MGIVQCCQVKKQNKKFISDDEPLSPINNVDVSLQKAGLMKVIKGSIKSRTKKNPYGNISQDAGVSMIQFNESAFLDASGDMTMRFNDESHQDLGDDQEPEVLNNKQVKLLRQEKYSASPSSKNNQQEFSNIQIIVHEQIEPQQLQQLNPAIMSLRRVKPPAQKQTYLKQRSEASEPFSNSTQQLLPQYSTKKGDSTTNYYRVPSFNITQSIGEQVSSSNINELPNSDTPSINFIQRNNSLGVELSKQKSIGLSSRINNGSLGILEESEEISKGRKNSFMEDDSHLGASFGSGADTFYKPQKKSIKQTDSEKIQSSQNDDMSLRRSTMNDVVGEIQPTIEIYINRKAITSINDIGNNEVIMASASVFQNRGSTILIQSKKSESLTQESQQQTTEKQKSSENQSNDKDSAYDKRSTANFQQMQTFFSQQTNNLMGPATNANVPHHQVSINTFNEQLSMNHNNAHENNQLQLHKIETIRELKTEESIVMNVDKFKPLTSSNPEEEPIMEQENRDVRVSFNNALQEKFFHEPISENNVTYQSFHHSRSGESSVYQRVERQGSSSSIYSTRTPSKFQKYHRNREESKDQCSQYSSDTEGGSGPEKYEIVWKRCPSPNNASGNFNIIQRNALYQKEIERFVHLSPMEEVKEEDEMNSLHGGSAWKSSMQNSLLQLNAFSPAVQIQNSQEQGEDFSENNEEENQDDSKTTVVDNLLLDLVPGNLKQKNSFSPKLTSTIMSSQKSQRNPGLQSPGNQIAQLKDNTLNIVISRSNASAIPDQQEGGSPNLNDDFYDYLNCGSNPPAMLRRRTTTAAKGIAAKDRAQEYKKQFFQSDQEPKSPSASSMPPEPKGSTENQYPNETHEKQSSVQWMPTALQQTTMKESSEEAGIYVRQNSFEKSMIVNDASIPTNKLQKVVKMGLLKNLRKLTCQLNKDYDKVDLLLKQRIKVSRFNQINEAIRSLKPNIVRASKQSINTGSIRALVVKKSTLQHIEARDPQQQYLAPPSSIYKSKRKSYAETHKHYTHDNLTLLGVNSDYGDSFDMGLNYDCYTLKNINDNHERSMIEEKDQVTEFLKSVPQNDNISDDSSASEYTSSPKIKNRILSQPAPTMNNFTIIPGANAQTLSPETIPSKPSEVADISEKVIKYTVIKKIFDNQNSTIKQEESKKAQQFQNAQPAYQDPSFPEGSLKLSITGPPDEVDMPQSKIAPRTPTSTTTLTVGNWINKQTVNVKEQVESTFSDTLAAVTPISTAVVETQLQAIQPLIMPPIFEEKKHPPGANSLLVPIKSASKNSRDQGKPQSENHKDKEDEQDDSNDDNRSTFSKISHSVISAKTRDGKKKINQYILMKDLGQGQFGKVKLVIDTDDNNKKYAMKIVRKKKMLKSYVDGKANSQMEDVMQEIAIMKKLNHENVVKLYEVLNDPQVNKLYIVMEYVSNGSLSDAMKTNSIDLGTGWRYFRDMVIGMLYLHECLNIIHRDIKPENLMIDENNRVKYTDFGLSLFAKNGNDEIKHPAGSSLFFAPEICTGKSYRGKKTDVWALGVTLYYMIFKEYPFYAKSRNELFPLIQSNEVHYPPYANSQLVELLKLMFKKNADERATITDIANHDWVTSNGVQPLLIKEYPEISIIKQDTETAISMVSTVELIQLHFENKVQELLQKKIQESFIQSQGQQV